MFKNKTDDEEEDTNEKRIGDNVKYDEDYYNNYIKQFTKTLDTSSKSDNVEQKKKEPNDYENEKGRIKYIPLTFHSMILYKGTVNCPTEEANIETLKQTFEPADEVEPASDMEKEDNPNINDPSNMPNI